VFRYNLGMDDEQAEDRVGLQRATEGRSLDQVGRAPAPQALTASQVELLFAPTKPEQSQPKKD